MNDETHSAVAVAMSGGVDSTVTASLLKDRGWDVIGVTMRVNDHNAVETVKAAQAAAAQLHIEHVEVDARSAFEHHVLAYVRDEYAHGRTPNPCFVCNRHLKFEILLAAMRERGLPHNVLATGHYARIGHDQSTNRALLLRGQDHRKDQSYFLAGLRQEQLRQTLFPLGDVTKDQVRARARELGLEVAQRPDSQDFSCGGPLPDLFDKRTNSPGPILDTAGVQLGEHRGIGHYTIGQRKGLGIAAAHPLYVRAIDASRNAIIVGSDEQLFSQGLEATDMNWIAHEPPGKRFRAEVRIRHNHAPQPAFAEANGSTQLVVRFDEPQRAITPGQAVVLYDGDRVLAGGLIERAL